MVLMFTNYVAGTVLQNTKEVYGVCVYAGKETKMSLNSKITMIKFSSVERSLNLFLLFFLFILVSEMVVSTVCSMTLGVEYFAYEDRSDSKDSHGDEVITPR